MKEASQNKKNVYPEIALAISGLFLTRTYHILWQKKEKTLPGNLSATGTTK